MSEPTKLKAIDLMTAELAPLILENGFRKYKKGFFVRMRDEILQYVYFRTLRPPFDVRYFAIPYWAVNEEYLVPKYFDFIGFESASSLADKLDGHDDPIRWQMEPSYRRWENWNSETLQPLLPLYAEKLRQYVFPMLDEVNDFDSYIAMQKKIANLYGYNYFEHLPKEVVKELCIRSNSLDLVYDFIQKARLDFENKYLAEKAKATMYYDIERAKERYQDSLNRLERLWQEFTDIPYGVRPQDVFGEEMNTLRTKRKEVIEKLLKLKIE